MIWSDHGLIDRAGVCAHRVGGSASTGQVDFDGDSMYAIFLIDLESKAKAYGGLGHHQVLDNNVPFKISKYAGQTATNLMNFNTLMLQKPIE